MAIPVSVRLRLRLECRMALRRLAQSGDRSDALPNLRADALRMHKCAQSIGRGARLPAQGGVPRVLALARQGLCFIPLILILTACFGILGVQLAQPAADVLTFLLGVPLGLHLVRDLNRKYENELRSAK